MKLHPYHIQQFKIYDFNWTWCTVSTALTEESAHKKAERLHRALAKRLTGKSHFQTFETSSVRIIHVLREWNKAE